MGALAGGYQSIIDELAEADRRERRHASTRRRRCGRSWPPATRPPGCSCPTASAATTPSSRRCSRPRRARCSHPSSPRQLGARSAPLPRHRHVLVAARPLGVSPYYTLNITDRRVPLTAVVETTHVVDPEEAGGSLVYLPKLRRPGEPGARRVPRRRSRTSTSATCAGCCPRSPTRTCSPCASLRAPLVEPIHPVGVAGHEQELFPAPGLAVASTAHVYPEIVNCQSVLGVVDRVVPGLLDRLSVSQARVA